MIRTQLTRTFMAGFLAAAATTTAFAAPTLKNDVEVASAIVTAGDLFDDAGINAERAMFRAPAPGTAGAVSIAAIRAAAARIGIDNFNHSGISRVRVERSGETIAEPMIKSLIVADLSRRGIVQDGVIAETIFEGGFAPIHAASSDEPIRLDTLRYAPASNAFIARFEVAGRNQPLELRGRLELSVELPHLKSTLPAGTILSPADIDMRKVPLRFAESGGFADMHHLLGKELQRPSRAGMPLRVSDVAEPLTIKRNEFVTFYYRSGPLTVSIKGQALNNAAEGEPVAVLNLVSKKIIHGVAVAGGTVELPRNSAHAG